MWSLGGGEHRLSEKRLRAGGGPLEELPKVMGENNSGSQLRCLESENRDLLLTSDQHHVCLAYCDGTGA